MSRSAQERDGVVNPLPPTLKAVLGKDITVFRMSLFRICDEDHVAALFLNQALYWTQRTTDPERWFWKTGKQWAAEIGLGRSQVDRVRTFLKDKGFLRDRRRRTTPAVLEYQLNLGNIEAALVKIFEASLSESDKLDDPKPTDHQSQNRTASLSESINLVAPTATDQNAQGRPSSLPESAKPNKEAEITSEIITKSTSDKRRPFPYMPGDVVGDIFSPFAGSGEREFKAGHQWRSNVKLLGPAQESAPGEMRKPPSIPTAESAQSGNSIFEHSCGRA